MHRRLALIVVAVMVVGCGREPVGMPSTATISAVPDELLDHTPTAESTEAEDNPTSLPQADNLATQRAEALPTQRAAQTATAAAHPPNRTPDPNATRVPVSCPVDTTDLPTEIALNWTSQEIDGQSVWMIPDWPRSIEALSLSPDGRWLALEGPNIFTRALIDTQSDVAHAVFGPHAIRWLPGGRGIWVIFNQATLEQQIGVGTAEDVTTVAGPDFVNAVWPLANGLILARDDWGELYRGDLTTGIWERAAPPAERQDSPYRAPIQIGFSQDRSHALFLYNLSEDPEQRIVEVWRITAAMGASPTTLGTFEYAPSEHPLWKPDPVELPGTPYWYWDIGTLEQPTDGDAYLRWGLVFNSLTGDLLDDEDFPLPDGRQISRVHASPDGRWLALSLAGADGEVTGIYIAPSNDITGGHYVEGHALLPNDVRFFPISAIAWGDDYAVFRDAGEELVIVSLPVDPEAEPTRVPIGEQATITTTDGAFLLIRESDPAHAILYGADGSMLGGIDLADSYSRITAVEIADANRIYLGLIDDFASSADACQIALLEWLR